MKRIAIFASGSGSNAENIINFFNKSNKIQIVLILSNSSSAGVLDRAKRLNINSIVFSRVELNDPKGVLQVLQKEAIDFIVLAGFLWLFPACIIHEYPDAIVNIHPALLPQFGGKGMYGMKVHEAVVEAKESRSGITIHYVNEQFDEGAPIFQAVCEILPSDNAEDVAHKVHALEYQYFPLIIEKLVNKTTIEQMN